MPLTFSPMCCFVIWMFPPLESRHLGPSLLVHGIIQIESMGITLFQP